MLGRFIMGLPTNALNKIFMSLYGVDTEEYYDSIKILLKRKGGGNSRQTNEDLRTALRLKLYNTQPKQKLSV
jgi:hypothetical protein